MIMLQVTNIINVNTNIDKNILASADAEAKSPGLAT